MSKLLDLARQINKDHGASIVTLGAKQYDNSRIPFTSPRVNYCLYGGVPVDKAIEFFGPEHSGKTTSALDIVANAQVIEAESYLTKLKLANDKATYLEAKGGKSHTTALAEVQQLTQSGPRKCVYVDAENTLDLEWAEKLGVDVDDMILIQPQDQSAEQVLQMILDVIDTGEAAVVVLDSLAVLVPQSILDEGMEKKAYCGVAGPMTIFCAKVSSTGRLMKHKTLFIGINQIREDINNPYNAYNSPGGKAWKHLCSVRMLFRKGNYLDANNNELAMKNASEPCGNKVDFTLVKSKICKPDRRLGFYTLLYNTGIDNVSDMIDLAIKFDLVQKGGAWFTLPSDVKVQGIVAVREYYNNHTDEYLELEKIILEKIK